MIKPKPVTDPTTGVVRERPGWSRKVANRQIGRLKHVFKWAVEAELVPGEVFHRLAAVSGLRCGRADVRETEPVKPVPDAYIDAVLPHVSRQVRAMIELQLLTGMRPGEVCAIRTCDLDMTRPLWVYRPASHKTAHHGHNREIRIGPRARATLEPFLKPDLHAHLFSPADAEAERHRLLREKRRSPVRPWEPRRASGRSASVQRKRAPREQYSVASYRRAIARACLKASKAAVEDKSTDAASKAGIPPWHPHQLRHNAATRLRRQYSIEVARIILGHRSASVTEVYAEMDFARADQVMAEVG